MLLLGKPQFMHSSSGMQTLTPHGLVLLCGCVTRCARAYLGLGEVQAAEGALARAKAQLANSAQDGTAKQTEAVVICPSHPLLTHVVLVVCMQSRRTRL